MKPTRRGFFKLAAGAAALVAVPALAEPARALTLWADNLHDDGPALNALFRGEAVRVGTDVAKGIGWRGRSLVFGPQHFRICQTLRFESLERCLVQFGEARFQVDHDDGPILEMIECNFSSFVGGNFDFTDARSNRHPNIWVH